MSIDNYFAAFTFLAVYVSCLLVLDAAHRSHIAALKAMHDAELAGMRTYIRTLNRERKWLEAELAKVKQKLAQREEATAVPWMPEHIFLPPSEEYDSGES
jgi:hypothetical protein